MTSCLCEYKVLVNAYKCEIIKKSHFLFVNGYKKSLQYGFYEDFYMKVFVECGIIRIFIFSSGEPSTMVGLYESLHRMPYVKIFISI